MEKGKLRVAGEGKGQERGALGQRLRIEEIGHKVEFMADAVLHALEADGAVLTETGKFGAHLILRDAAAELGRLCREMGQANAVAATKQA
jgi:hypothetical protein